MPARTESKRRNAARAAQRGRAHGLPAHAGAAHRRDAPLHAALAARNVPRPRRRDRTGCQPRARSCRPVTQAGHAVAQAIFAGGPEGRTQLPCEDRPLRERLDDARRRRNHRPVRSGEGHTDIEQRVEGEGPGKRLAHQVHPGIRYLSFLELALAGKVLLCARPGHRCASLRVSRC